MIERVRRGSFSRSPSPEKTTDHHEHKPELLDTKHNSVPNDQVTDPSSLTSTEDAPKEQIQQKVDTEPFKTLENKDTTLGTENGNSMYRNQSPVSEVNKRDSHLHYDSRDDEEIDNMFVSDDDLFSSTKTENKSERKITLFPNHAECSRLECDDEEGYYVSYIGEIIGSRYKVYSNSTAKGVFSSVVRCINLNTQNEVAIKIIRLNDMMRSTGEKEFEALKLFRGVSNIVQVQDSFLHQGHFCIVFEWLSGSLKGCINEISKYNISKMKCLARQIFTGIKHIHERGYIHTDIKPENILVDSERTNFKISDFGNAIKESEASPASYLVSRFYRPPEIIIGSLTSFGKSLDIWSVGCVLYECFTGNILFRGRSNNDMIKLIVQLRGNVPKKMLRQGLFTKDHFSPDYEKLFWRNHQNMIQTINNSASNTTIYQRILSEMKDKMNTFSEPEAISIRKLSNLIERCLVIDPKKRISAKEALEHPFFTAPASR